MFETKYMFVLHGFHDSVGNCRHFFISSGGKFQFDDYDDTAVCLTFRVSIAVMVLLVAASDLGLFTSAAFYFLKILFHMSF